MDTYDLLSTGEGIGDFQCNPGMRRLIVDLKPKCFEDIIALLALYRPGTLGSGIVEISFQINLQKNKGCV